MEVIEDDSCSWKTKIHSRAAMIGEVIKTVGHLS